MSDEDERQTKLNIDAFSDMNNRRLSTIRIQLQELTREKTKYIVEKLIQDIEFLQSELGHLSHTIADLNREIIHQIYVKKNLNAKMAMLRSNSGLRFPSLDIALRDKKLYEEELGKPHKTEVYRDLARQQIKLICEALPQLQKQEEYLQNLQQAEDTQIAAQKKREKFQENLNTKSRKQAELKQLLNDSATKVPELETSIENLRLERDRITVLINDKKQRRRSSSLIEQKSLDSPVQSFASLEYETLEYEKRRANEQLEKLRLLINYFHDKMSQHNLTMNDQLTSSFSHPRSSRDEKTILLSSSNQQDSPCYPKNSIEYKKELPSDILDKYAGISNKKQQHGKKNKKNKKNFGIRHSSQMVILYNDVRKSSGNSDTLPYMPLYEYELPPTIHALQLLEQSIQLYLNQLSKHEIDEDDDDDRRDSALDTFSEASSLIEPINMISKDSISLIPQLGNIPEARSSSSSDDKKTIVSSSSSDHHGHSKKTEQQQQSLSIEPLTTVDEFPPLTAQIAQIDRQISDEGYRSVRNEKQQATSHTHSPLLIRSKNYDCTEKVGKWLSDTTPSLSISTNDTTDFQSTDVDQEEEDSIESHIPVSND